MSKNAVERKTVLQELESFESLDQAVEELSISATRTENLLHVVKSLIDHLDDCVDRVEKNQEGQPTFVLQLEQVEG